MDFKVFMERVYDCRGDILTSRLDFIRFIGTEQDSYQLHCRDGVFMDFSDHRAALAYTTLTLGVQAAEYVTRGSLVFPDSDEFGRGLPFLAAVDVTDRATTETGNMDPGSCLILPGAPLDDTVILFDSEIDRLKDFIPDTTLHRFMLRLRDSSLEDYTRMVRKGYQ